MFFICVFLLIVASALTSPNDWEPPTSAEIRVRFAAVTSLAFQRFGFFDSLRWAGNIIRQSLLVNSVSAKSTVSFCNWRRAYFVCHGLCRRGLEMSE